LITELKLVKRVRAVNLTGQMKLVYVMMKYKIFKRNYIINTVVSVDGIKYKLLDLESLFIISPHFEDWLWNYLNLKKNDLFIDVGAHIGKYTFSAGKIVGSQGKVLAIEPDPDNFRALQEGLRLNGFQNVTVLNIAAWNEECTLPFYIKCLGEEHFAKGKGFSSAKHQIGPMVKVSARSLDAVIEELDWPWVSIIKIDVEGSEYEVLMGSRKLIQRDHPKFIVECSMNEKKVFELMQEEGYNRKRIEQGYYLFENRK
jgi:FkbM family methyltransferase